MVPKFSLKHASRHVRHARTVMHVGIANPRWRGKRSRHSRRMRNPQFYFSGKTPIGTCRIPIFPLGVPVRYIVTGDDSRLVSSQWETALLCKRRLSLAGRKPRINRINGAVYSGPEPGQHHYNDVIMGVMVSRITSLTIVYASVYAGADQRKHQSAHHGPLCGNSPVTGEFPNKWLVSRKSVSIWWRHHGTLTNTTHMALLQSNL